MIPRLIRRLTGMLFFYSGAFHLIRWLRNITGKRLTIVTYHRITDRPLAEITDSLPYLFTTVATFRKQLDFFRKWYTIITFKDLMASSEDKPVPPNSLIITFDDGYEDNFRYAFPELRAMNLRATYFLASGKIGDSGQPFWWDQMYSNFNFLATQCDGDARLKKRSAKIGGLFRQFKRDHPR